MRKRILFQKTLAAVLAVSLCASMSGCSSNTENTTDTTAASVSQSGGDSKSSNYQVTDENENEEMVMNNQPESSYWFPEELLEWSAEEDTDLPYNVSTVPMAKRVDRENLTPVNQTQNKDTKVMAISIMNSSTSGNSPHGLNKADCNTFTYWQYVDKLVYWGGSSGEGLIVTPSPDVTNEGHKNGVPVIGTVFFPQDVSGGKMEWLDTFLQKDDAGSFPLADKLIEVAQIYGFDGWFINQETEGSEEEPLTAEHAALMQEFIKYYKEKAPEMDLVYYDSMTSDGEMDWQNALTDKNLMFLKDSEGNAVADDMFLNFWWTEDELAGDELLKSSAAMANENGIDPYSLYAGVDIQSDGYTTPIRWDLFESSPNSTYTSLGLYCPSWAYSSATDPDDFHNKETSLWVNNKQDPSAEATYSSPLQWRGVSTYVTEKSAITSLPFTTNFSTGNGYSFFREGEQISKMDWNNRSVADILPTYRFIMENEGTNDLQGSFDIGDAYYGGNSLKFRGKMEKDKATTIKMFSADLPAEKDVTWTTTVKASAPSALDLVLTLDDDSTETISGDKKAGTDWTVITYDISKCEGKNIRSISYKLTAEEDSTGYEFHFGSISVTRKDDIKTASVTNVAVDDSTFDEDGMYAGVRLSWESSGEVPYYEVYRINEDKTRSFLGVSNTTCFYVNTLPRTDKTNQSEFEVIPVDLSLKQGEGSTAKMEWPDNSLPKANFSASQTLIAPGTEVTFENTSSENTEEVSWTFTGADKETASDDSVTVTYDKEGVYDVTLKAKNEAGEAEKTVTGCIVVTSKLSGDLTLLSSGKETEATAFVNDSEAPEFAVDGDVTKKWCATGTPPHELTIDLGETAWIGQVGISHAEAGGEGSDMNTKAYTISVSTDGVEYTDVVNVTKNTTGSTLDTFAPVEARYVKLSIVKPTQGSDTAARIYEVEVYGINGAV